MPYKIIRNTERPDLVHMLENLLSDARDGTLVGMAAACVFTKMRFFTPVAGIFLTNPTFGRGVVAALDDELADMVHERDPLETR